MCQNLGREPKDIHVVHELIRYVSINMLHVLCYMEYRREKVIVDTNCKLNSSYSFFKNLNNECKKNKTNYCKFYFYYYNLWLLKMSNKIMKKK